MHAENRGQKNTTEIFLPSIFLPFRTRNDERFFEPQRHRGRNKIDAYLTSAAFWLTAGTRALRLCVSPYSFQQGVSRPGAIDDEEEFSRNGAKDQPAPRLPFPEAVFPRRAANCTGRRSTSSPMRQDAGSLRGRVEFRCDWSGEGKKIGGRKIRHKFFCPPFFCLFEPETANDF